jgi:peptide/nickel transport system ATP-binding protein
MSEPILEIRNLTVALPEGGDRPNAVEDLTLTIGRGELVCVVGESGSGKSITAFSVMGLLPNSGPAPVSGEIVLGGKQLLGMPQKLIRQLRGTQMGMVFQEPMTALNPVFRIGYQIDEVLGIHTGLSAADRRERSLAILAAMHLPDPQRIYDSYPHQLSGGQRQRVVIAMAMILDPALLICDEPTTALDVTTQAQILQLIKELQSRRGTGVLFITHDFGVVADIADRVVVMRHGCVVEQGTADAVLGNPCHEYTRALIDAVPKGRPLPANQSEGPLALQVRNLGKTYGGGGFFGRGPGLKAAHAVNFSLRRGETLGVVGESGSGKTTVARCVARLIEPNSGTILLDDHDITHLKERKLRHLRRHVQIVFQDPYRSLNPRRNIEEAIVEGPMNFGVTRRVARERASELLRLVGLNDDAFPRYPHQFSGGQRQRIALARALAMEPKLLIADEAVSALDVSVQRQVLDLLTDVKERYNLAILFITHDLRVAAEICNNIIVMKNGEIVEYGSSSEIFTESKHPYTQLLLESAPGKTLNRFYAA